MEDWESALIKYRQLILEGSDDFNRLNQYKNTYNSTAIEGSTLSLEETTELLENGLTYGGKPFLHYAMVRDHYESLKFVLNSSDLKVQITVDYIQKINALVMAGTGATYNTPLGTVNAAAGEFRKGNVHAGNTHFVGYNKVVPYIKDFVAGLNKKLGQVKKEKEVLELSFVAHFDLVSIHPFYDGNGRTSRLLMNDIQHRFNMPVSIVFNEDKVEYIQALIESRKQESTTPIVNFMFCQYSKQLQKEITAYKKGIGLKMKPIGKRGLPLFF